MLPQRLKIVTRVLSGIISFLEELEWQRYWQTRDGYKSRGGSMSDFVYWVLAGAFAAAGGLVLWNASGGTWWLALIGGFAGVALWFILGALSVFETLYRAFTEGPAIRRATNIIATLAAFVLLAWSSQIIRDRGELSSLLMVTLPAILLLVLFPYGLYDRLRRSIRRGQQQPAQQPVVTPLTPTGPAQAEPARQPQRTTAGLNIWLRLGLGLLLGVIVNIVDYFLYATVLAGFGTIVVVMGIVYVATRPRPEVAQQQPATTDLASEARQILDQAQVESAAALVTYRNAQQTLSEVRTLLEEFRRARQATGLPQEPQGGTGDEPAADTSSRLRVTRRTSPVTPVESEGGDEPQATDPQGSEQDDPFGELDQGPSESGLPPFLPERRPNPA